MADTETLTRDERELMRTELSLGASHLDSGEFVSNGDVVSKALRIIDAQAKRIEGLQRQLPEGMQSSTIEFIECPVGHGRLTAANWIDHGCPHCRTTELEARHAKARQRIAELEAQVLAADTVSKAEYQAMVQQRDTLRQERNAAREEAAGLKGCIEDARTELKEMRKEPRQAWSVDELILRLGGCEED